MAPLFGKNFGIPCGSTGRSIRWLGVLFLFMMTFNGGLPNLSGGPDYSPIWIGILFGVAVFIGGIMLQSKFKGGVVGCLICGVGFGMLAFPGWLGLIFLAWPRGC